MREPIYEKLAPNEALIIAKEGDLIEYVINKDGKIIYKKEKLQE